MQVGACARPDRDGVLSAHAPDSSAPTAISMATASHEAIVVDRSLCTADGNCYWNVFVAPPAGASECARYAGTFEARCAGAAGHRWATTTWPTSAATGTYTAARFLLQSYRFLRGGYRIVEALLCKRAA